MTRSVLVVGAGLAGATYARALAENGYQVNVIDKREHIAGSTFDELSSAGSLVHRYGPHIFHTSNRKVIAWISRFSTFIPYQHRVGAELSDGRIVPFPVNRKTINTIFGVNLQTSSGVHRLLNCPPRGRSTLENAAEYLLFRVGPYLTNLLFRPYTRKMWDLDLEDVDVSVVKRVSLRFDDEDRYFPSDCFQGLPANGYTKLFESILDHKFIKVALREPFHRSYVRSHAHCFNSMAIDEYFNFEYGYLPYRSVRFHHFSPFISVSCTSRRTAVTNLSDKMFTRETDWSLLPSTVSNSKVRRVVTREQPCDDWDNRFERFYPVITRDGRNVALYQRYKVLADRLSNMTFIGRCGTYQYLNMDQVINQSLVGAHKWAKSSAA